MPLLANTKSFCKDATNIDPMLTHLFFDFDGVIANSIHSQVEKWNDMLARFNKDMRLDETYLRQNWTGDVKEFYKNKLNFSDEEFEAQIHVWRALGGKITPAPLVDGMQESLIELGKKFTLVVVSSNYKEHINPVLINGNVSHLFHSVFGPDEANGAVKPHPDAYLVPLRHLGIERENAMVLGDSVGDIHCAHAAGIRSIACAWGWNSREMLAATEPEFIAEKPSDLLRFLTSTNL